MPDEDDKPLADVRRARHDTDGKRHGIHGKTARRNYHCDYNFLTRAELTSSTCVKKKIMYTALELEGRDARHSLDRDLAWEHVPSLLHEHTIKPPEVVKKSDGTVETTFQLEPLVEEVPCDSKDDELIDARRRPPRRSTDGKIYTLRNGKRPTLFAVPSMGPPEQITRGKLLAPVRMGDSRNSRTFPLVRRDFGASWDVTKNGGVGVAKLDIDLGVNRLISHISTQGRSPPTRVYPEVRRERRRETATLLGVRYDLLGRRAQRTAVAQQREMMAADDGSADSYWVEGRRWDLLKHGQYPGPFWDVLNLKGDEERCKRTGRLYQPSERWLQWVGKYEVHYRTDGGRQWHKLQGAFKGNTDATSEVAHDVRGLVARYLRIVPLEVEGMGAMRVGIYGHAAAGSADSGSGAGGEDGGEEPPEPISYTIRECPEGLNKNYTYCERHTYRGGKRHRYGVPLRYVGFRELRTQLGTRLHAWREDMLRDEREYVLGEEYARAAEEDSDAKAGGAPPMPTMSAWFDGRLQTRATAARLAALDAPSEDSWSDGEWSDAWSEAAWSELSAEEQWLQVTTFAT